MTYTYGAVQARNVKALQAAERAAARAVAVVTKARTEEAELVARRDELRREIEQLRFTRRREHAALAARCAALVGGTA